jgi:hypothetical protein
VFFRGAALDAAVGVAFDADGLGMGVRGGCVRDRFCAVRRLRVRQNRR